MSCLSRSPQGYHPLPLWLLWISHTKFVLANLLPLILVLFFEAGDGHRVAPTHILLLVLELLAFISIPVELTLWMYDLLPHYLFLSLQTIKALFWTAVAPISIRYLVAKYPAIAGHWEGKSLIVVFVATPIYFWLGVGYAVFVMRSGRKR